jgi:hypothetical protein
MEVSRLTRFLLAGIATLPLCAQALDIELISRTGIESAMDSDGPTEQIAGITPDGRYTLFPSYADNLVAGDSNRVVDLFVHDATSGTLERVSVGSGGIQADVATGTRAGLSDDARYVVFDSTATTLVATPTFGHRQIYLRDRLAGTTSLLSKFSGGVAGNADSTNPQISADGRYVVFDTRVAFDGKDANGARDVYRLDRQTGLFELMSISETGRIGNAESFEPQISADGSSVAFFTWATNLVPNDTNGYWDLLLRKPAAGTTQRISRKSNGSELAGFANLVPISALSADGRYVLMNTYVAIDDLDTNSAGDGYRYDSQTGEVQRVTRDSTGAQIEGYTSVDAMSRDGVRIVMHSSAANVMPGLPSGSRVFVRDIGNTTVTHVTFRNGSEIAGDEASGAVMSDDGTNVVAVTYNGRSVRTVRPVRRIDCRLRDPEPPPWPRITKAVSASRVTPRAPMAATSPSALRRATSSSATTTTLPTYSCAIACSARPSASACIPTARKAGAAARTPASATMAAMSHFTVVRRSTSKCRASAWTSMSGTGSRTRRVS